MYALVIKWSVYANVIITSVQHSPNYTNKKNVCKWKQNTYNISILWNRWHTIKGIQLKSQSFSFIFYSTDCFFPFVTFTYMMMLVQSVRNIYILFLYLSNTVAKTVGTKQRSHWTIGLPWEQDITKLHMLWMDCAE